MDNYGAYNVVNLLPPKDTSAGAFSTAYVDMENWGHGEFGSGLEMQHFQIFFTLEGMPLFPFVKCKPHINRTA